MLLYVREILNNISVYIHQKTTFFSFLLSSLTATKRLAAECIGVGADHLLGSCCCGLWWGRRTRTKCHYGDQSLIGVSDVEKHTEILLWIYLQFTSGFFFYFVALRLFLRTVFPFLNIGESLQAPDKPLHPNQTQRGLQLIDITVILFWSTFFLFFISTALHCSLSVHRRLVAVFFLSPFAQKGGKRIRVVATYLRGWNSASFLLDLTVHIFTVIHSDLFLWWCEWTFTMAILFGGWIAIIAQMSWSTQLNIN